VVVIFLAPTLLFGIDPNCSAEIELFLKPQPAIIQVSNTTNGTIDLLSKIIIGIDMYKTAVI
jgi:hypothetical protein